MVLSAQLAFAQQGKSIQVVDPWDWNRFDTIKIIEKRTLGITTKTSLWIVERSADSAFICNQPILFFVGGYLPTVDEVGYKTLIEYLAKRNIAVISPEYDTSILDSEIGFHTDLLAIDIEKSLHRYIQHAYASCKNPPKVILYGHSIGARIAMAMMKNNQQLYDAFILDGVGPDHDDKKNIVDHNHLWSDDDQTIYPNLLTAPLTVIHYEGDHVLQPFTERAYKNIRGNFKQMFEIKSLHLSEEQKIVKNGVTYKVTTRRFVQADHFSPMSGPLQSYPSILRNIVFNAVKDIHGYRPNIVWNEIDEYASLPILTAISWATMSRSNNMRRRTIDLERNAHSFGPT